MTDIHEKLAQTGAIEDAFRLLTEVSEPLMVLHVEAGGLKGEIWLNNDRRLFFAKATGDGDNGLMALMMMFAARGARFSLDVDQEMARRPNIEVVIHLDDCVKNQAGVAQKIKDILWPVNESNIDTEACEALPAEMLQAAIFGTSSGFFGAPAAEKKEEEAVDEGAEEEKGDGRGEMKLPLVHPAKQDADRRSDAGTAEQGESRSVPEQPTEPEQPLLSFAPEPTPFPTPPLPTPPLTTPPLLEPAVAAAIAVPKPEPADEPAPLLEPQPMLGANAAEAEELEAPMPAAPPPPAPPLAQSGRFTAPIDHVPPTRTKRFPFAAITTTAAALAILCAVGFTVYSGITSGAQALREDTDAANQFVADTIEAKSPPKPSSN